MAISTRPERERRNADAASRESTNKPSASRYSWAGVSIGIRPNNGGRLPAKEAVGIQST